MPFNLFKGKKKKEENGKHTLFIGYLHWHNCVGICSSKPQKPSLVGGRFSPFFCTLLYGRGTEPLPLLGHSEIISIYHLILGLALCLDIEEINRFSGCFIFRFFLKTWQLYTQMAIHLFCFLSHTASIKGQI